MSLVTLTVAGMTCGHCVQAVTGAIRARDPTARVEVDLSTGVLRAMTSLPRAEVRAAVLAEGYRAE